MLQPFMNVGCRCSTLNNEKAEKVLGQGVDACYGGGDAGTKIRQHIIELGFITVDAKRAVLDVSLGQ